MIDLDRLRNILRDALHIDDRADKLTADSRLLGEIPEFDSVAIVAVVVAIENEYGFKIPDRELSARVFETVGSLAQFISMKTGA